MTLAAPASGLFFTYGIFNAIIPGACLCGGISSARRYIKIRTALMNEEGAW
jgi:hypothetical protein